MPPTTNKQPSATGCDPLKRQNFALTQRLAIVQASLRLAKEENLHLQRQHLEDSREMDRLRRDFNHSQKQFENIKGLLMERMPAVQAISKHLDSLALLLLLEASDDINKPV